jgi:hypothetical protein
MSNPTNNAPTANELDKALTLIPQIKEAHEKAESCQQTSYNQALEYAIKAGELLILAKEAVGHGGWATWRQQNLPSIPQTTASLYMRLAEHKDRFKETKISNSVADLKCIRCLGEWSERRNGGWHGSMK